MGSPKTPFLCLAATFLLLFAISEATEFIVGGKEGAWKIPTSSAESLNEWAEKTRFKIGDSLVWKYDGKNDSVLEVTKENYAGCKKENPIKQFSDGNTNIELGRSGPFYFISGAEGHCEKGEKVIVVVLSPRDVTPAPEPAPAPGSGALGLQGGVFAGLGTLVGMLLI